MSIIRIGEKVPSFQLPYLNQDGRWESDGHGAKKVFLFMWGSW